MPFAFRCYSCYLSLLERKSLRDEFALAKGERMTYQETMMILCLLC